MDCTLASITYFLILIMHAPRKNSSGKEFPIEIFGFIYSIVMMYFSAGEVVIEIFTTNNSFEKDIWIYGYGVILISYLSCVAFLNNFMERNLSRIEIIFVGMIMVAILEFMTYYGIGFFGGIIWFNPQVFDNDFMEAFALVINRGIYIASQSQGLERSTREIFGYIILNGTDILTITVVLGYVVQKFVGINDDSK